MRTTMRILFGVLAATLVALLAAGAPAGLANAAVRQATPAPEAAAGQPAAGGFAAWLGRPAAGGSAGVGGVAVAGVRFQVGTPAPSPAPAGPDLNQGNQAADHALVQRRLVLGLVSAVLLLIVYVGRRARNKHTARLKNLQNAKG